MPSWLVALAVTLGIEVPLVAALYPGQRLRLAAVSAGMNVASNLFLNLILLRSPLPAGAGLVLGEALAVSTEAVAYYLASRPRDLPRSLFASSLANLLSFSVGFTPELWRVLHDR